MFGLFSKRDKNFDYARPDAYEGVVTQKEYEQILDYAIESINAIEGKKVANVKGGDIVIKNDAEPAQDMHCYLDNLVRKCKSAKPNEWQEVVKTHFAVLSADPHKEKFIFKDFEFAEPLLKFVVRHHNTTLTSVEGFVHRIDLPETCTFLILDYDNAFHFVHKKDIKEWEKSEKELFDIAFANIANEEIEIGEMLWKDEFEAYTFFSGDFSASFIVDLERNGDFSIGQYGALLTIPTKGSAIVHPLNGNTALSFIASFHEAQQSFFHQDEVPITDKYYWFYEGTFELFSEKIEKGHKIIALPPKLDKLLSEK
jgi:hypothetical protein